MTGRRPRSRRRCRSARQGARGPGTALSSSNVRRGGDRSPPRHGLNRVKPLPRLCRDQAWLDVAPGGGVGVGLGEWVGSGECDGAAVGWVVGACVGSGECDGSVLGAVVGACVGSVVGWFVGDAVGDDDGCGVSNGVTTPTWTIALAPLSPSPTSTHAPIPTGVIVKVGLAPLVFTIPVQSPWRVNAPVKPCWTNVTGAGVEVIDAN